MCARQILLIVCAVLATALPSRLPAQEAPIILQPFVWEGYQEYLSLHNPSAFAVSRDGRTYGYSYCPERRCRFNTDKKTALDSCAQSGGEDCLIFAIKDDIKVAYRVLDLASTGGCPTLASSETVPEIVFVADIDEVVYDHSLDIAEITNLEMRGKSRTEMVDFELMGMALHEFARGAESAGATTVTGENGGACAGLTVGEVHLRLAARIYVAKEFPQSSCMFEEILAHERRHHDVAVAHFTRLAEMATRYLATDLTQKPYVAVEDAAMAGPAAKARIDVALERAYQDFLPGYEAAQDEVDSDEEYARIAAACPDVRDFLK